MNDSDRLITAAARQAADHVQPRTTRSGRQAEWPLEREQLGREMKKALVDLGISESRVGLEAVPVSEGWNPAPGNLDLTVERADGGLWFAAELKLESINETLWDVFRLTTACTANGAEVGYLVIAAYESSWTKRECRVLFPADDEAWLIPTQVLISRCHRSWRDLLAMPDNKARISVAPRWLELKTLETEYRLADYPHLELRVARVRPMGTATTAFNLSHWPESVDPETGALEDGLEDHLWSERERWVWEPGDLEVVATPPDDPNEREKYFRKWDKIGRDYRAELRANMRKKDDAPSRRGPSQSSP